MRMLSLVSLEHLPYLYLTPRMTDRKLTVHLSIHNDQPPVAWNGGTGKTISREVIQSFCQPAQDIQVGLWKFLFISKQNLQKLLLM